MTMVENERPILDFPVTVAGIRRLSPTFVRVSFRGDCLFRFATGGPAGNRDRRVSLIFPSPGHRLPEFNLAAEPDRGNWYRRWQALDQSSRGVMRTFTVRRTDVTDTDDPQIAIDFALHVADDSGPASRWAATAAVGDEVTIIGPNAAHDPEAGIAWRPGSAQRLLLAGDETAVPAVSAILESLPEGSRGNALLEVPTAADVLKVDAPSAVAVMWLPRDGRLHGERLQESVRAAGIGLQEPADVYGWLAGEASTVKAVRRQLVRECGIDRRRLTFMGYWRAGRAEYA